jgi:hypothetical protein
MTVMPECCIISIAGALRCDRDQKNVACTCGAHLHVILNTNGERIWQRLMPQERRAA